jgi:hypothetical protein
MSYAQTAARAAEVIERKGRAITLRTTNSMTGAQTNRDAYAVLEKVVRHTFGDSGVQVGDSQYLFRAEDAPAIGERLVEVGLVIRHVEPIQPGDTVVAWYAWARAG